MRTAGSQPFPCFRTRGGAGQHGFLGADAAKLAAVLVVVRGVVGVVEWDPGAQRGRRRLVDFGRFRRHGVLFSPDQARTLAIRFGQDAGQRKRRAAGGAALSGCRLQAEGIAPATARCA